MLTRQQPTGTPFLQQGAMPPCYNTNRCCCRCRKAVQACTSHTTREHGSLGGEDTWAGMALLLSSNHLLDSCCAQDARPRAPAHTHAALVLYCCREHGMCEAHAVLCAVDRHSTHSTARLVRAHTAVKDCSGRSTETGALHKHQLRSGRGTAVQTCQPSSTLGMFQP